MRRRDSRPLRLLLGIALVLIVIGLARPTTALGTVAPGAVTATPVVVSETAVTVQAPTVSTPPVVIVPDATVVVFVATNTTLAPGSTNAVIPLPTVQVDTSTFVLENTTLQGAAGITGTETISAFVLLNLTAPFESAPATAPGMDTVVVSTPSYPASSTTDISIAVVVLNDVSGIDTVGTSAETIQSITPPPVLADPILTTVPGDLILEGVAGSANEVLAPTSFQETQLTAAQAPQGRNAMSQAVVSEPASSPGPFTLSETISGPVASEVGTGLGAVAIALEPFCSGPCTKTPAPFHPFPLGLLPTLAFVSILIVANLLVVVYGRGLLAHWPILAAWVGVDTLGVAFIVAWG